MKSGRRTKRVQTPTVIRCIAVANASGLALQRHGFILPGFASTISFFFHVNCWQRSVESPRGKKTSGGLIPETVGVMHSAERRNPRTHVPSQPGIGAMTKAGRG